MKIHLDRDFMCAYFLFTDKGKSVRFEIGDEINIYFNQIKYNLDETYKIIISEQFSTYNILNITSKLVVLESYGRCYYLKIEELEQRIKI